MCCDVTLETKGLAIVRYVLSQVKAVPPALNDDSNNQATLGMMLRILGKVMIPLQSGLLPTSSQLTETWINAQPHMKYVHEDMKKRKILVGHEATAADGHHRVTTRNHSQRRSRIHQTSLRNPSTD